MNHLTEIAKHSIEHDRALKKICEPLHSLGISIFEFYAIDEDGNFVVLSTYPEQLDFYYSEKLYLREPYLRGPHFFRCGYVMIPTTLDSCSREASISQYQYDHLLLKLERKEDLIEGYIFSKKNLTPENSLIFFNHLELLDQFAIYFKREAKKIISKLKSKGFNLKRDKKDFFFDEVPNLPLTQNNSKEDLFLKKISPLSPRERECVTLFKQGYTAHATAALLGLSQRTVEFYFDNIKTKLNCKSKWELLNH